MSLALSDFLQTAVANIPTAGSLPLKSQVERADAPLPHTTATGTERRERDSWMLDPGALDSQPIATSASNSAPKSATLPSSTSRDMTDGYGDNQASNRTTDGGVDFFSSLGTEHKRKDLDANKPDPAKAPVDYRELNVQLKEGKSVDEYEAPTVKKVQPGGPGYQWRMTKLKRLYEQVAEQSVHPSFLRICADGKGSKCGRGRFRAIRVDGRVQRGVRGTSSTGRSRKAPSSPTRKHE